MGRRQCELDGCTKWIQGGGTPHCVAHGGGKRCQEEGCLKSARCDTGACAAHGGGRRCQHLGCPKGAASGGTQHCQAHGGGKRCQKQGCSKAVAQAPGSMLCTLCLRAARFSRRVSSSAAATSSVTATSSPFTASTNSFVHQIESLATGTPAPAPSPPVHALRGWLGRVACPPHGCGG